MEKLKDSSCRIVGTKQVLKAINEGKTCQVYLAADADNGIQNKILLACSEKGFQPITVKSMHDLGIACKIQVGAATACIKKSVHST